MKKTAIFLAIAMMGGLLTGCFTSPQEITFTTPAYSFIVPGEDTIDLTTAFDTNAYLSKVVCAEEDVLDAGGPALQSAYSQSDTASTSVFNLDTTKLEKFEGMLCDLYIVASDESTVEETEAVLRVYIGAEPIEVVEEEVCEDGTVCVEEEASDEEVTEEEETTEEEVIEETTEEIADEDTTTEE